MAAMLTQKVKRNWHQAGSIILARSGVGPSIGLLFPTQTVAFGPRNYGSRNHNLAPFYYDDNINFRPVARVFAQITITNATPSNPANPRSYAYGVPLTGGGNFTLMSNAAGAAPIVGGQTGTFTFEITPAQAAQMNPKLLQGGNRRVRQLRIQRLPGGSGRTNMTGTGTVFYYQ